MDVSRERTPEASFCTFWSSVFTRLIYLMLCCVLCWVDDAKPAKKGRKRKLTAPDGPKKPTIISSNSSPGKASSPAKKKGKKQRNPWSDSEGSDANDSDKSDLDMDTSFTNVVEREKAPRRAAGQICYCLCNTAQDCIV